MAKKLGFFLIFLNVVMAAYVFYLRPLAEIDPLPEKNQIYPERIQIIQDVGIGPVETGDADSSN
jgi:hypothetical protein